MPIHPLAALLAAVVLLGELPVARRRRADGAARDRGSWAVVVLLSCAGYAAGFALPGLATERPGLAHWIERFSFGGWSACAGAALVLGGTALRLWAIRTLGRYFTPVVRVWSDQKIVARGPYRRIRHPSYLGAALAAAGVGAALGNALSLGAILLPMLAGLGYRIEVEEQALLEATGPAYRAYRAKTKRLVPFVF